MGDRCDWIPACAAIEDGCLVSYEISSPPAACGQVRLGTYVCGDMTGYSFEDGTSFGCLQIVHEDRTTTNCLDALEAALTHCREAL
jgi:hypothetical protein